MHAQEAEAQWAALAKVARRLNRVSENVGLAEADARYEAMAGQFERLRGEHDRLEADLSAASAAVVWSSPADAAAG